MTIEFQVKSDATAGEILTVGQLNQRVGQLLESNIPMLWIRGEISNFTQAASGHWYFTLKDSRASVRAVMFRGRAAAVGFVPRAGDKVELRARVSLYEPRGDYQLQVEAMRRAGLGDLFEAFLRLKKKLEEEGLFLATRKRVPTAMPRAIGVITSPHAAALRDVLSALARRAPQIPLVLYPAPVQGSDAAARLAAAIVIANQRAEVDTLLLVRGGGSIEDLWSFNEEILARSVADSAIPIICGVGHETDFTIADFVADLRAPTPTAAAELACPPRLELYNRVMGLAGSLVRAQERSLERLAQRLDRAAAQLVSPAQRLAQQRERLATLRHRLLNAWRIPQARRRGRIELVGSRLLHNTPDTGRAADRLKEQIRRLKGSKSRLVEERQVRVQALSAHLRAFDPQNVLARGYALVRDKDGRIVRDARTVVPGQAVDVRLGRGAIQATVAAAHTYDA